MQCNQTPISGFDMVKSSGILLFGGLSLLICSAPGGSNKAKLVAGTVAVATGAALTWHYVTGSYITDGLELGMTHGVVAGVVATGLVMS